MSATNRGSVRMDQDAYFTPHPVTYGLLPLLFPQGSPFRDLPIIDPAAGEGHILTPFARCGFPLGNLWGLELDAGRASTLRVNLGCTVRAGDTLADLADFAPPCPVTIVANPPYSLAFDFVRWGVGVTQRCGGRFAALLRINFLASKGRAAYLRAHPPALQVLPTRPSFVRIEYRYPDGELAKPAVTTDATEYAWYVWGAPVPPLTWAPDDLAGVRAGLLEAGYAPLPRAVLEGPPPPVVVRIVPRPQKGTA